MSENADFEATCNQCRTSKKRDYQTSNNKAFKIQNLDLTLSLTRHAHTAKITDKKLDIGKQSLTLNIADIVEALKGQGHADAKITYELITQVDDAQNTVKKDTQEIEFVITIPAEGDTCTDYSIFNEATATPSASNKEEVPVGN